MAAALLFVSQNALSQTAKIQAVHNSPDAALSQVDIYLGDIRIIDNIGFRVATPFLDAPVGIPLTFTIAPANSTSVADGFYSTTHVFNDGTTHVIVASGIQSATGYSPSPAFELTVFSGAFSDGFMPGYAGILINHSCTDAGNINVSETGIPLGMFIYDMPYSVFTAGYQSMPVMNYVIGVTKTADNTVLGSYSVPLATMQMDNKPAMILSSGFVNPENNSNGAEFGLFMVLPEGGNFIPLQSTMGEQDFDQMSVTVYPNPASDVLNLHIPSAATIKGSLYDMSGREVMQISDKTILDVSGLANGIFMLHAEADGKTFTKKVVIQH